MTKLIVSIVVAIFAVGLVVYGFVSGGMTQLVILVSLALVALGFVFRNFWKLNETPPKDDLGNYFGGF